MLNKDSVYNMFILLKNRFIASDYAYKQEYTIKQRKTYIALKQGTKIDPWLYKLKTLYNECKQLNILNINN